MKATIRATINETPRVVTLIVAPKKPVSFATGQSMKLTIPGAPVSRLYSIASPGSDAATELWFTIGIVKDGRLTSHVSDLKVGDVIDIDGPFGNFVFDMNTTRDVALVAGGTGISVLRSIYQTILTRNMPIKVHLLFSVLENIDVIYRSELEQLAKQHQNFSYSIVITNAPADWKGHCGLINKTIFDAEFGDYHHVFYVCGPKPFIDCAEGVLHEAQVPPDRIKIERWDFKTAPPT